MEQIAVRELNQHTSRVLARVRAGETVDVTDVVTTLLRRERGTTDPVGWLNDRSPVAKGVGLPADSPGLD